MQDAVRSGTQCWLLSDKDAFGMRIQDAVVLHRRETGRREREKQEASAVRSETSRRAKRLDEKKEEKQNEEFVERQLDVRVNQTVAGRQSSKKRI